MNKDKDKNKRKAHRVGEDGTKEIIDLRAFITPDMVNLDTNGSYTGVTYDTYYNGDLEEPVQDVDDL